MYTLIIGDCFRWCVLFISKNILVCIISLLFSLNVLHLMALKVLR